MKEFYGSASIVIDLNFSVKANSIEEAKEKILCAESMDFQLKDFFDNNILEDYETNDWYVVDKAQNGNIRQSGIHDFEIEEEVE